MLLNKSDLQKAIFIANEYIICITVPNAGRTQGTGVPHQAGVCYK